MFESEFYDKYFIAKLLPRYNKGQLKKKKFFKKDVKLSKRLTLKNGNTCIFLKRSILMCIQNPIKH